MASPDIVVLVPVPVVVFPPGLRVNVQVPEEGNPLSTTLPVATLQVGCVMAPTVGAVGAIGAALITKIADAGEIHVVAFVTV